jgi:hypothetical protein
MAHSNDLSMRGQCSASHRVWFYIRASLIRTTVELSSDSSSTRSMPQRRTGEHARSTIS